MPCRVEQHVGSSHDGFRYGKPRPRGEIRAGTCFDHPNGIAELLTNRRRVNSTRPFESTDAGSASSIRSSASSSSSIRSVPSSSSGETPLPLQPVNATTAIERPPPVSWLDRNPSRAEQPTAHRSCADPSEDLNLRPSVPQTDETAWPEATTLGDPYPFNSRTTALGPPTHSPSAADSGYEQLVPVGVTVMGYQPDSLPRRRRTSQRYRSPYRPALDRPPSTMLSDRWC